MEMLSSKKTEHHLYFGTINGYQFVDTTFGITKLGPNISVTSWVIQVACFHWIEMRDPTPIYKTMMIST